MLSLKTAEPWFVNLPAEQQELLKQSVFLIEAMRQHERQFYDYAFVIMPAAKAYEGFVKDLLFRLQLISRELYVSKHFRVGKSLNPELEHIRQLRRDALFNEVGQAFGSQEVPQRLWDTWQLCRNQIFHYYPKVSVRISLEEAQVRIERILETIRFISVSLEKLS